MKSDLKGVVRVPPKNQASNLKFVPGIKKRDGGSRLFILNLVTLNALVGCFFRARATALIKKSWHFALGNLLITQIL